MEEEFELVEAEPLLCAEQQNDNKPLEADMEDEMFGDERRNTLIHNIDSSNYSSCPNSHQKHQSVIKRRWSSRQTFAVLCLCGGCLTYMLRMSLSITIVAMVGVNSNSTANTDADDVCPLPAGANDTQMEPMEGEFDWDEKLQGALMSSFFYGYVATGFLGGVAAEYFGGHLTFGVCIFMSSILCMLSPICARTSVELFIALRVLSGLVQGPMFPAMHSMMAAWIPQKERSKYNAVVFTGSNWGTVFAMAFGGVMCSSSFLGGWPAVYYVFGGVGVMFSILWFILMEDAPNNHQDSSSSEGKVITAGLQFKDIKWRAMMSPVLLSLMVQQIGEAFGFFMLITELPTYLSNIQHFDMEENGFISALPYILSGFFCFIWGYFVNYLTVKDKLSLLSVRRMSTAVGMFGAAAFLILMCFVNCNSIAAVVVICAAVTISGASITGGYIAEQDICPPALVGVVKGMVNSVASIAGILAPFTTGIIISDNETLSAWRTVFLISAAVYVVSCIYYLIFATDKMQPWKKSSESDEKELVPR